jgi:hypothetical protein
MFFERALRVFRRLSLVERADEYGHDVQHDARFLATARDANEELLKRVDFHGQHFNNATLRSLQCCHMTISVLHCV